MIRRKKEERLGVRIFRFYSYMPPFFFDFFFLAFVGLFTRLHIHNGVCLRILLFFWKPIFPTVLVETGPIQCRAMKSLAGSFFLRIFPCCTFFHRSNDESPETILPIIQPFFFWGNPSLSISSDLFEPRSCFLE